MRIISEEILGYNVSVFVSNYTRRLEEVTACGALNLESWGGGPLAAKDVVDSREGGILLERELGVTGVEGLYVPQEVPVSARYYELLQQNAPVAVEVTQGTEGVDTGDKKNNVLDFFPLNGTLHNLLLMERVREVDVNCSATVGSDWAEYLCSDDHWVPPQCEGAHPPCRELYLGDPDWSSGEFEAVIRNKNLSFTIHYLGPKGVEHVIANYSKIPGLENGIVYYWWEPEPFLLQHPSARIVHAKDSSEEGCRYFVDGTDEMESDANCIRRPNPLVKWMSSAVAARDPDLASLFELWSITNDQLNSMLRLVADGGGNLTVEEAACAYLRSGSGVDWESWLSVSELCFGEFEGYEWSPERGECVRPASASRAVLIISVSVVASSLLAVTVGLVIWQLRLRRYVAVMKDGLYGNAEALGFESPLEQAVRLLQELSEAPRLTHRMRAHAVRICHYLLNRDIYAPIVDEPGEDGRPVMQSGKIAMSMVQLYSPHAVWVADRSESSSSSATKMARNQVSGSQLVSMGSNVSADTAFGGTAWQGDGNDGVRAWEFLHAVRAGDPGFFADVGKNLLQDSLRLAALSHGRPLFVSGLLVLHRHGLFRPDRNPKTCRFLVAVEDGYLDNPYHNSTHAADVLSRVSAMISADGILTEGSSKARMMLLAVIVAAVIHDYAHPGTDNNFQVKSDTYASRQFNQQMVLENLSLYRCLEMMRNDDTDLLSEFKVDRAGAVEFIIRLVLATDMTNHFSIVGDFNSKVIGHEDRATPVRIDQSASASVGRFNSLDDKLKVLVLSMAIKVADIGHSMAPFPVHKKWAELLQEEFFQQGEEELRRGWEPDMLKHPRKPGAADPANQAAFFSIIVIPTLKSWAKLFVGSGKVLLDTAVRNWQQWQDLQ